MQRVSQPYEISWQIIRGVILRNLKSKLLRNYLFISAAGVTAPPVYVMADDRMAEGDFKVYEVVGLGLTTEVADKGYVVYCKTRCGMAICWILPLVDRIYFSAMG